MKENYTYHFKKRMNISAKQIYNILFQKITEEFPDYHKIDNPYPSRKSRLQGYGQMMETYHINLHKYKTDDFIEIQSRTQSETYMTRYEVTYINDSCSILHVYEKMDSTVKRVAMNYLFLSFFIKFGKKQKWKQIVGMIESQCS